MSINVWNKIFALSATIWGSRIYPRPPFLQSSNNFPSKSLIRCPRHWPLFKFYNITLDHLFFHTKWITGSRLTDLPTGKMFPPPVFQSHLLISRATCKQNSGLFFSFFGSSYWNIHLVIGANLGRGTTTAVADDMGSGPSAHAAYSRPLVLLGRILDVSILCLWLYGLVGLTEHIS